MGVYVRVMSGGSKRGVFGRCGRGGGPGEVR